MENTRPGNFDRAWNDPPLFDYNTAAPAPSQGTKLNKRIGFPSSTPPPPQNRNDSSSSTLSDAGAKPISLDSLPPPPPPSLLPPPPSNIPRCDETPKDCGDKVEVKLEDVISALETNLVNAEEAGKIDSKKVADIRKRLVMFQDKWNKDHLNDKVCVGMSKLANCLADGNFDEAEKIQCRLNVDYPNICTPWMIAIRQMILAQKGQ